MHGFWSEVFARWRQIFKEFVKEWQFWLAVAVAPIVAVSAVTWAQFTEQLKSYWWVTILPLAISAFYALKRAVEEHYDALQKQYVEQGDKCAELQLTNRKLTQHNKHDAHTLVGELLDIQHQGISLRNLIKRKASLDSHTTFKNWRRSVEDLLKAKSPIHLNQLRLQASGIVPILSEGSPQRTSDFNELAHMLAQLQDIIMQLRKQ
jgi:hypothetical protein